jgi:hypothetical protein
MGKIFGAHLGFSLQVIHKKKFKKKKKNKGRRS